MPGQNLGTPFLERIMRTGKKRNALLNTPTSGGVNMPSPTGVGSGQGPPPRKPPAAVAQGPPAMEMPTAAPTQPTTAQPQQPSPEQVSMPALDVEFPTDTVAGADGEPQVVPAVTLTDRFYRTYGRMPNEVDMYILSFRKQFERNRGRPPSKEDILASVRKTKVGQEGVRLI